MLNTFFYPFSKSILDIIPYKVMSTEEKSVYDIITLGMSSDDVSIEVKNAESPAVHSITVSNKNTALLKRSLTFLVYRTVKEIEYESKNGITSLVVTYKDPEISNIKITKKYQE